MKLVSTDVDAMGNLVAIPVLDLTSKLNFANSVSSVDMESSGE